MEKQIPEEYFMDEVRDGFFVPSMIKKSWAMSYKNYNLLAETCEKLGGKSLMFFGSLIGIIRNAGSIPWDDDVDTIIVREDYNALKELADKGELPANHFLRDYTNMTNANLVRKWFDCDDAVKPNERWEDDYGFPFANNVDIFITDHVPDSEKNIQYFSDVIDLCQHVKDYAEKMENNEHLDAEDEDEFAYSLDLLQRVLKVRYVPGKDGQLTLWVWKVMEDFLSGYIKKNCENTSVLWHYMISDHKCVMHKRWFDTYIDMPYEFGTVKVPVGYDCLVRSFYPFYVYPRREYDGHSYPNYKMLEQIMKEHHGMELTRYKYDPEQVAGLVTDVEAGDDVPIETTIKDVVESLKEAHAFVDNACKEGKLGDACGVLVGCQDLAVSLGETIESKGVDCSDIISVLEQYCEKIYHVYQKMSAGESDAEGVEELKGYEDKIRYYADCKKPSDSENSQEADASKVDASPKKEVLFLVRDAKHWKSLHTLWEAAASDESAEATVIVVPFFYKDGQGKIDENKMIIKNEDFPSEVELTAFDDYKLEVKQPDVVIFQEPYDEFSDAYTVHPYFYATNLKKYAKKLVFVPSFVVDEVTPKDERSRFTLGCYINNSGPALADRIYAQSENMKNVYAELMTQMSDQVDWGAKISGLGLPIQDFDYEKVRPASDKKYVLLYHINVSILYEFTDKMIERFRKLIGILTDKLGSDFYIRYFEDANIHKVFSEKKKGFYEKYKAFVEEIKTNPVVIFDDFGDIENAVRESDGYYGDGSVVMTKMREMRKPVLWQEPFFDIDRDKVTQNKWNADLLVVSEEVWTIENFLHEMKKYTDEMRDKYSSRITGKDADSIGNRMWSDIKSI